VTLDLSRSGCPTRYHGCASRGEEAPPEVEKPYIDLIRREYYTLPQIMRCEAWNAELVTSICDGGTASRVQRRRFSRRRWTNDSVAGLKNTLILAAASTILGVVIGMMLAIMGISRSPWLRIPARVYTDIFRGLPAIVTILLIGQGFARLGRELFGPSPYPCGSVIPCASAGRCRPPSAPPDSPPMPA